MLSYLNSFHKMIKQLLKGEIFVSVLCNLKADIGNSKVKFKIEDKVQKSLVYTNVCLNLLLQAKQISRSVL